MPRIVLIVPDDDREVTHWIELAQREDANEILRGVPPYLAEELADVELPYVYTEPDPEPVPVPEPEPPAEDPVAAIRADLDWLINYVVTGEG